MQQHANTTLFLGEAQTTIQSESLHAQTTQSDTEKYPEAIISHGHTAGAEGAISTEPRYAPGEIL